MDLRALVMGLVFSLMWSSAFATARVIVADAPPLWALTLRFALSGLIAVAVARALGQSWQLTRPVARSVIIFGLCQNALYLGLNFVALQWVQASVAAIIASAMPLIVAVLGWLWRGERVAPLGQIGLGLGFAGVALIMGSRLSRVGSRCCTCLRAICRSSISTSISSASSACNSARSSVR